MQTPPALTGSDGENHLAKRQRVSQACHHCRAKKYKCDGKQPVCSTCKVSNRECTYDDRAKKRGLQTGYVKAMERLWGLVFSQVEGSEDVVYNLLEQVDGLQPHPVTGKSEKSEELSERWRQSGVPSYLDALLLGQDGNRKAPAAFRPVKGPVVQDHAGSRQTSRNHLQWRHGSSTDSGGGLLPSSYKIPELPRNWPALIQAYLSLIHIWLPIIERQELFARAHSYQEQQANPGRFDPAKSGPHAAMWGVLALGAMYSDGMQQQAPILMSFCETFLASRDKDTADVPSTQALILLSLIYLGFRQTLAARVTLAQAIVSIQCKHFSSKDDFGHDYERRKGLLGFGCFVLDGLVALHLCQKPMMTIDDLVHSKPCDESSLDEWEPYAWPLKRSAASQTSQLEGQATHIASTANYLVALISILNDALHRQRPVSETMTRLDRWQGHLPPYLYKSHSTFITNPDTTLPHIHVLYLTYSSICAHVMGMQKRHQDGSAVVFSRIVDPAGEILAALGSLEAKFGSYALPPISEIFISSAYDFLRYGQTGLTDESTKCKLDSVKESFRHQWLQPAATFEPSFARQTHGCAGRGSQTLPGTSLDIIRVDAGITGSSAVIPGHTSESQPRGQSNEQMANEAHATSLFSDDPADWNGPSFEIDGECQVGDDWMRFFDAFSQSEKQDESQFLRSLGYYDTNPNLLDVSTSNFF